MPKHIPPARNEAITIMPVASNGFGHSVTIAANGGKTRKSVSHEMRPALASFVAHGYSLASLGASAGAARGAGPRSRP